MNHPPHEVCIGTGNRFCLESFPPPTTWQDAFESSRVSGLCQLTLFALACSTTARRERSPEDRRDVTLAGRGYGRELLHFLLLRQVIEGVGGIDGAVVLDPDPYRGQVGCVPGTSLRPPGAFGRRRLHPAASLRTSTRPPGPDESQAVSVRCRTPPRFAFVRPGELPPPSTFHPSNSASLPRSEQHRPSSRHGRRRAQ